MALGAATGGAALAATGTIGRFASRVATNDELKAKAASGDRGAQRKLALANSIASRSFDLRQTGLGKYMEKKSGMDLSAGTGVIGLGTDKFKGGRKEMDKKKAKELDEIRKTYMLSKSEEQNIDSVAKPYNEKAQKQNERAEQYDKDKKLAQEWAKRYKTSFIEAEFKKDYIKGGDMAAYGVEKTVQDGGVDKVKKMKTAKEINDDRQDAYALSLENPNQKIEDGKVIRAKGWADYGSSFGAGAKDPRTLAATAATTALAGPVGLLVPVIGGLSAAIKDMARDQVRRIPGLGVNQEIIAAVRRGVKTDKEEAWHHMKEAYEGDTHATHTLQAPLTEEKTKDAHAKEDNTKSGDGAGHPPAH